MESDATTIADVLIWAGAGLSLLGLAGLIWCIVRVSRARRAKLADDAMRKILRSALPLNLGSLLLSVFGLMLVILGIFLA